MRTQQFGNAAVAAIGVAAIAALLMTSEVLEVVQRPLADLFLRASSDWSPEIPAGYPDVAIVAIDKQSLKAYEDAKEPFPWPRDRYTELLRELDRAGAKSIAFDLDFSTARRGERRADMEFARAIPKVGRVVLSASREFQQVGDSEVELANLPAPEFASGAAAIGSALAAIDGDGVVRNAFRGRLITDQAFPSLAEAAVAVALGEDPRPFTEGQFPIDYRRASPQIPTLSFIDVIEGRYDRAVIAGRVVFVGVTAADEQDLWPTPLGPNRSGVFIHAVTARHLLAERAGQPTLHTAPMQEQLAWVLFLSILGAAIGTAAPTLRWIGFGLMLAAVPAGTLLALARSGVMLDAVIPWTTVGLHYMLGLEGLRERFRKRLVERERSLTTLFNVGEATSRPVISSGLDLALALLGDVVGASGVALLRAKPDGKLDDARLVWPPGGNNEIGDMKTAQSVLTTGETYITQRSIPGEETRSGLAVYTPLIPGETAVGVLIVERDDPAPLDETELRTVATVGAQLGLSVDNIRLLDDLKDTFNASIEAIATAVEARDGYTDLHCRRLSAFSTLMAQRLGLPDEEIEAIRLGALLHDVGKIGVRDEILLKPGRLNEEERRAIEEHPDIGMRIIAPIRGLPKTAVDCVRFHHERWDGTGYPTGLAAEDIPLAARIVSIVDVWDALSSKRPYKEALPQPRVRDIIEKDIGVRFDAKLVELFFNILDEQGEDMVKLIATWSEKKEEVPI